jgi:hypothetical protein
MDSGTTQMQPVERTVAAGGLEHFSPAARCAIELLYAATDKTAYNMEIRVFHQRHLEFLSQMNSYLKTDSGQRIQSRQYNNLVFPAELIRAYMLFEYTLAHFPNMYSQIRESEYANFFKHCVSMYRYFMIFKEYEKAYYTCKCIAVHRQLMRPKENILDIAPLENSLRQNNIFLIQHYIHNSNALPAKLNGNVQNIQKILQLYTNLVSEMQSQGLWLQYVEHAKRVQKRP